MKRVLLTVILMILMLFPKNMNAQNCMSSFIENLKQVSSKRNERYIKKAKGIMRQSKVDDYNHLKIINIPIVFSTNETEQKIRRGEKLNKNDFFCYFNPKSLAFDESLILQDTIVTGFILQSAISSTSFEFVKNADVYRKKLAKAILEVNPDFIFGIYNISTSFWCLINNELFALSYQVDVKNFTLFSIDFYIENELKEEDLFFITNKKVFYQYKNHLKVSYFIRMSGIFPEQR